MPIIPKNLAAKDAVENKIAKESPEDRLIRILNSPLEMSVSASCPQGGRASTSLFLRFNVGEEEFLNFNMGVPAASELVHNAREAELCRRMAAALLANAEQCDLVNEMIRQQERDLVKRKIAKLRVELSKTQVPAERRQIVKNHGFHSDELVNVPNGKKFDEALEAMLQALIDG